MAESDRTTSVEYRTIARHGGFRFGSDASVQTCWTLGVKPKIGDVWRNLRPQPRPTGYSWVCLGPAGTKPSRLDEVICEAFHGERPPGTECLHRDGDRSNCLPSNLSWGIAPENVRDPAVEYRRIPECEGYQFGSDGSLWSAWGTGYVRPGDVWRRMHPATLDSGHLQVAVKWNGKNRRFGAHHLICTAFHGPCPDGMECCHKDGVPHHNQADNLRWGTPKENVRDQMEHGVFLYSRRSDAKLTIRNVRIMREAHANGATIAELAARFNVSWTAAQKVVNHETYKHVR